MNPTDTRGNAGPANLASIPVVLPETSTLRDSAGELGRGGADLVSEGAQLGPFRLVSILGRGGMGTVWRAEDTVLHRPVALKFLSAGSADARERFLREARLAAGLSHPNIVTVHHVGEHEGVPFIVTELVAGGSLDRLVDREGPLPPARAATMMLQAARALQHAHEAGVIHRDIKPGNMLLAADGTLKVADFGLARSVNDPGHAAPGVVVGTPPYLAPEICAGATGGPAGDIYALGCTFYYLLAGRRPFRAETSYEYFLKHCNEPMPDVRSAAPAVPGSLAAIVKRACEKDTAYRYGSAAAMAVDLESALAEMGERKSGSAAAPSPAGSDTGNIDLHMRDEWADGRSDEEHNSDHVAAGLPRSLPAEPASIKASAGGAAMMRNLGVLAGLAALALFVWFVGAVFQRWPDKSFFEDGLHPFDWHDIRNGRVLAYMYWLAFGGLAVGPLIAGLGAKYGRAGYVTGILFAVDVGLAAGMAYWGPMWGMALLAVGCIPALCLMAFQSREEHGFGLFGAGLLAAVGALVTISAEPSLAIPLGGLFDGRLHGNAIQWWHYIAFSVVPAVLVFVPAMITGIFDVGFLRRGRLQTGLGVCFLVSIFIWGPAAGVLLPLIPLTFILGTMAVLDLG